MGTLKNGIEGGVSGKVGNVIFSSWNGIPYVRSRPAKYNDAKTGVQVKQRGRFSLTMDFMRTITPFVKIGFGSQTGGRMTAFNAAMSYNMKYAVQVEKETVMLDYPSVCVSLGSLSNAAKVYAEVTEGKLRVNWDADAGGNARPDDIAMMLAYNPEKHESMYDLNAGKRTNTRANLPLPPTWKGDRIETYLAFKTADGTVVSKSIYTGQYPVY